METTIDIVFSSLNILLSVTAIWIAIKSSRNTSKDATRQIESIKQLAKIQIETSIKQLEMEIQKNVLLEEQANEEWNKMLNLNSPGFSDLTWKELMMQQYKEQKPKQNLGFYQSYNKRLYDIKKNLNGLMNKLEQQ